VETPVAAVPLVERRIRWASLFVVAGLLVQLISLLVIHPLAFVAFLMLGCPLIGFGIIVYLLALVSSESSPDR
jgi:hypothetical protein